MDTNERSSKEHVRRQRSVSESSSSSSRPKYTEKQRRAVDRVLNLQSYYDILVVKPDATTDEINSAYKKLALRLHPDKNKAPGAKTAFQVLGHVKDVLSDPVKRNLYDMEQQQQQKQQQYEVNTETTFGMGDFLIFGGLAFIGIGAALLLWKSVQEDKSQEGGKEQIRSQKEKNHSGRTS